MANRNTNFHKVSDISAEKSPLISQVQFKCGDISAAFGRDDPAMLTLEQGIQIPIPLFGRQRLAIRGGGV